MLFEELPYLDPLNYFHSLENEKIVFLDSNSSHAELARYSYIAFSPSYVLNSFDGIVYKDGCQYDDDDVIKILNTLYENIALFRHELLPPFQGGFAGYFSYDFARNLEVLPDFAKRDEVYPDFELGCFDLVLSFDHILKKLWLISSGLPETKHEIRLQRAKKRLNWAQRYLADKLNSLCDYSNQSLTTNTVKLESNFAQEDYINAIKTAKDFILEGDIFEVNLSQRFTCYKDENISPNSVYTKLRSLSPAPFSAYVNLGDTVIASSSPERFLQVKNQVVETRPIKGTRPRGKTNAQDEAFAKELLKSKKDWAENTMVVDLMRNDLSRACKPNSITVPQYCGLESYQNVHHLVSVVKGILNEGVSLFDLLAMTFPGGSITGAPKIRAMEIIDELEPTRRGPYCGSVGYISSSGDMDLSITIRTMLIKNNSISYQVGGAVILDSDPKSEYNETITKASCMRRTISEICSDSSY
jgi:para-aminobenzoate synthetase component 1